MENKNKHTIRAIIYICFIIIGLIINVIITENKILMYETKHFISGIIMFFIYLAILLIVIQAGMGFFNLNNKKNDNK